MCSTAFYSNNQEKHPIAYQAEESAKKGALHHKVQHYKHHADVYGQIFVSLDSRGGNLKEFFRHKASLSPPALSHTDETVQLQ